MRAGRLWLGVLGAGALSSQAAVARAQAVGPEFQVNTHTTGNQGVYPYGAHLVAADASGNFIVVWSGVGPGDGAGVFGQRYDSTGVRRGSEFRVNSYTTGGQGSPSVVAAADGDFVVVWAGQGQGDSFGVFAKRYDSAGNPLSTEFRVNSYTTSGQGHPSAAAGADGAFVVVWGGNGQGDYDDGGIFGQRYDSEGVPRGGEFQINSFTTNVQVYPSVASDASGNFVVVWLSYDDCCRTGNEMTLLHNFDLLGQRYDRDGAALGAEFQVTGLGGGVESTASVASDASGNFVVVWDSTYADIYGQRYDSSGTPLGDDFVVSSYSTEYQFRPSVAMDASGNFVVAWDDYGQPEDSWGVFARQFNNAGVPQGDDFQVNTYTYFIQQHPSVAATGSEEFTVVWESFNFNPNGQDGSGSGVFGQRFDFDEVVTVKTPNTNVKWRIGSLQRIQWTHNVGLGTTFRIELDRNDDGSYEELIAAAAPAASPTRGTFAWAVTGPPSGKPRVRVSWTGDLSVSDVSDVTFQIRPGG